MKVRTLATCSLLLLRRNPFHLQSIARSRMMLSSSASNSGNDLESLLSSHITAVEGGNPAFDPSATLRRVRDFYLPVYRYFCDIIHSSSSSSKKKPIFIGISAPQGCGKTTLTDYMRLLFKSEGLHCVVISLDDFYLTGEEQDELAERSRNPLLAYRGNAGTHDVPLMMRTLRALAAGDEADVPRYDKALRSGRGDRSPSGSWERVRAGEADVVLFEGWMLGFSPLTGADASVLTPSLREINELLYCYEPLHALFDAWLVLALADLSTVYEWRAQAERVALAQGRAGLSEEQVRDFVSRFMPAYKAYLPRLYREGPCSRTQAVPTLKVTVASDRSAVERAFL